MNHRFMIYLLAFGGFLVGTAEMVIAGILDMIADDFRISVGLAGQSVTLYALVFAIGTPILIAASSRVERKTLLLAAYAVFIAGNLTAFASASFGFFLLSRALLAAGAKVQAYDPEAATVAKGIFGNRITYAATNYDALKGADALVIVTEWSEFRRPDFSRMRTLMKAPIIFDGRNLFTPDQMKQNGFSYYSIGRH